MNKVFESTMEELLAGKQLIWVGGSDVLEGSSLSPHLAGRIAAVCKPEKPYAAASLFLEEILGYRPDWNRVSEDSICNAIQDTVLSPPREWFGADVLPYYASVHSEQLAKCLGSRCFGNPADIVDRLYLRAEARSMAEDCGVSLPKLLISDLGKVASYREISECLESTHLVITPEYSDGGAGVHHVTSEEMLRIAVRQVGSDFPSKRVEIAPFYEGVPINMHVCVVPDENSGCNVVVYPPSVQIIGEPTLSDSLMRYCGCDFSAVSDLSHLDKEKIVLFATRLGKKLFSHYGWKGLFGVDLILRTDGELVFLEINPRIQSSTALLDLGIHGEHNPLYLHIASFIKGGASLCEDIDLTHETISASMLVAYNKENQPCFFNGSSLDESFSGLPSMNIPILHGGVLFRKIMRERVLKSGALVLRDDLSEEMVEVISNCFSIEKSLRRSNG